MNTYLECIPCFFSQALFAARAATRDEKKAKQVLDRVAGLIPGIPLDNPPPETARLIYSAVREVTGVLDLRCICRMLEGGEPRIPVEGLHPKETPHEPDLVIFRWKRRG